VGLLQRTMDSFLAHTNLDQVCQVIISNDGSTDTTSQYLRSLQSQFPKIRLLPKARKRMGLIPRFNMALQCSDAGIVCEFQDDVEFYPGWLEQQLAHIDAADFITGFDAPEHTAFSHVNGYPIKHSSRFTQLTARRKVWNRWFPMTPMHPFPSPANGQGSKIDIALSAMKVNQADGKTRFLVVPGLLHTAEHYQSTWRGDISGEAGNKANRAGGLLMQNLRQYWVDRYASQKEIAVGYGGLAENVQHRLLAEKQDFILGYLDTSKVTLDYGCGTGLYSHLFRPERYLGVDITREFIDIARVSHPDYRYQVADDLLPGEVMPGFEQFFTVNVLQHNSDYIVAGIFQALAAIRAAGFTLALYENSQTSRRHTYHMRFRQPQEYLTFVAEHFTVKAWQHWEHVVHNEQHSFIRIEV
jgi:SAM-dependent methyltransferase